MRWLRFAKPLLAAAGLLAGPANSAAINVFAAASLTDVLQEAGAAFAAGSGTSVKFSFGSSATLARQIEAGAPADVFAAADQEWMDYLAERRLVRAPTRRTLAGNELVLVAPADSRVQLAIAPGFALRKALGDGRLATGDPASVPAGRYAKAALEYLGVWTEIRPRLVQAENVRAALAFVARGEAPFGIVYATDARAEQRVRVVATFPAASHAPIVYPAALTASARPAAAEFLAYLASPEGRAIFRRYGFTVYCGEAPRGTTGSCS